MNKTSNRYEYNYELYDGHGCGQVIRRGWIYATTQAELRAKAIELMSKTEKQTISASHARYPRYSETAIDIYNHYFGSVNSDMGEWWDKNGMHAFDKKTGKALGKTGR